MKDTDFSTLATKLRFWSIWPALIKPFRAEYSLRPVKTAFHGELVSNNEIFISYDGQVAHTGITEFFLFSLYFFNQSKGLQ